MSRWLPLAAVLTFVAPSMADGTAFLTEDWGWHVNEPVHGTGGGFGYLPESGEPYYNVRIAVSVAERDDWTAAALNATLYGPVHFLDGDSPGPPYPPPPDFPHPDDYYVSYYTSPDGYPNAYAPGSGSLAIGNDTPTTRDTSFFDLTYAGGGDWYLVQLTVVPDQSGDSSFFTAGYWSGDLTFQYAFANSSGTLFDFAATLPIPEPGVAALFAAAVLIAFRHRG